jgi:hypothetical protein
MPWLDLRPIERDKFDGDQAAATRERNPGQITGFPPITAIVAAEMQLASSLASIT